MIKIKVIKPFESNDSIKINNLSIENNTTIFDDSEMEHLSLLFGDYPSSDYTINLEDTLIVAAPKMTIEDDITIIAGIEQDIEIPPINIVDDALEQVLDLSDNKYYYLTLDGISDYEWASGFTCTNMVCERSDNNNRIKI